MSCVATCAQHSHTGELVDAEVIPARTTFPSSSVPTRARQHVCTALARPVLLAIRPVYITLSVASFQASHESLAFVREASRSAINTCPGLTSPPRETYALSGFRCFRVPFVLPFSLPYYTSFRLTTLTTCPFTPRPMLVISRPHPFSALFLSPVSQCALSHVSRLARTLTITFDVLGRSI